MSGYDWPIDLRRESLVLTCRRWRPANNRSCPRACSSSFRARSGATSWHICCRSNSAPFDQASRSNGDGLLGEELIRVDYVLTWTYLANPTLVEPDDTIAEVRQRVEIVAHQD